MDKERRTAYILLLVTEVIWAVATIVIKYTLGFINLISFLFWRFLIASWIFLPFFIRNYLKKPIEIKDLLKMFFFGAFGTGVSLWFLFEGMNKTTAIDSVVIEAVSPLFIILGGSILLKEKVEKHEKIGIAIACLGTFVTIIQPFLERGVNIWQSIEGNVLVLLSCISWTVYALFSKKDYSKHSPFMITAVAFFAGLVFIMPFYFLGNDFYLPSGTAVWGILYMSLFSSFVGYFTYAKAASLIEVSEATVFAYIRPMLAVPLAFLFLKEKITVPFLVGVGIIGFGVYLAEFYRRNKVEKLKRVIRKIK